MKLFLSSEERGVVSFKFMRNMRYGKRILLSAALIASGFAIQILLPSLFIFGCAVLLCGNLLLLVNGYDNRVQFGKYNADSKWEKVDKAKFMELREMQNKMNEWDRSPTDSSNPLGCLCMLIVMGTCAVMIFFSSMGEPLFIAGVNIAILLLPHWITGLKLMTMVLDHNLEAKINVISKVIEDAEAKLADHKIEYYMLLTGKDVKIPKDVKFRVAIKDAHPDFIGLYGQVVLNDVQGKKYPYFYTVLVAKAGYGLDIKVKTAPDAKDEKFFGALLGKVRGTTKINKRRTMQKDVEVLVIRQHTTEKSGYYTSRKAVLDIFLAGLKSAEINAVMKKS
ncbi:MAG: hypothetical protein JW808_02230 [Victivallales bacterium]|nr:hypothetical protein [Victivallales bacterium]